MRLSSASVAKLRLDRPGVQLPSYDRSRVVPGIVHLGIGNFHRAHMATYVDSCLPADLTWGIRGMSVRSSSVRNAIFPQDYLYTVSVKGGDGTKARVIGVVLDVLCSSEGVGPILQSLDDHTIRIVSLTVTEKGYCHDPATGNISLENSAIAADLAAPESPGTLPGLIVEALRLHRARGIAPFTVLCCYKLPSNGKTVARIIGQMATVRSDELSQ